MITIARKILSTFTCCLFVAHLAVAEPFYPVDSGSALESRMAALISDKVGIEAVLEPVGGNEQDQRVRTLFAADKERGTPRLATYVDTSILGRKGDRVVTQLISVFSVADIDLVLDDRPALLEWANNWNGHHVPTRVQIAGDELITSDNIVITALMPVDEDRVVHTFMTVTYVWPAILNSLRKYGLLKE